MDVRNVLRLKQKNVVLQFTPYVELPFSPIKPHQINYIILTIIIIIVIIIMDGNHLCREIKSSPLFQLCQPLLQFQPSPPLNEVQKMTISLASKLPWSGPDPWLLFVPLRWCGHVAL